MSRRATGVQLRPLDLTDIHILVVDDYEDTLELFRVGLQAFGAKVLTARTARDALAIIKTVRVNAMVSDLAMPGEDGLWLVEQLRRLRAGRQYPGDRRHGAPGPLRRRTDHRSRVQGV